MLTHKGTKVIETERLILRQYTWADFEGLYEILSDPETMAHYPKPYDAAGVRRWIDWSLENYEKYGFGLWAVCKKDTGEMIWGAAEMIELQLRVTDARQIIFPHPTVSEIIRETLWEFDDQ